MAERLRVIREFRWSSYRAYAGYGGGVGWLWSQPLDRLCGGRSQTERRAALREYTEGPVRKGVIERPWDRLLAGLVLGSAAFARRLQQKVSGNAREQPAFKQLAPRTTWAQIVRALVAAKGQAWEQFGQQHGDWGRDAALWLGRKRGGYRLGELGQWAGGMDYAAVGQAVSRFGKRLEQARALRQQLTEIERHLSNVEM